MSGVRLKVKQFFNRVADSAQTLVSELQHNLEKLTPEEKFRSEVERVKVHEIKKIKKGQYNRWKSQFRITKKFRKVNTRRKVSFRGRTRESFRFDLQLQEVNKNYRASREKGDS